MPGVSGRTHFPMLCALVMLILSISAAPAPSRAAEVFKCLEPAGATWLMFHGGARGEAVGGAYSPLADGISEARHTNTLHSSSVHLLPMSLSYTSLRRKVLTPQ